MLPLQGRILLSVLLALEEGFASVAVLPYRTPVYLGFLSWSCDKAEMKVSKQTITLNVSKNQQIVK